MSDFIALNVGKAWMAARESLPENWNGPSLYQKGPGEWTAYAVERSQARPIPVTALGKTPEEALSRLAEKLEDLEGVI